MSLPPPAYNNDPISFAYPTVRKRWPTILEGAIADIAAHVAQTPAAKECGDHVTGKIRALLEDFKKDAALTPFSESEVDKFAYLKVYNDQLSQKQMTWLSAPWLFSECYLYQLMEVWFKETRELKTFDVFESLKNQTFKQSSFGVLELCKRYQTLGQQLAAESVDKETLKLLFVEFADISLWGNATDLSLLAGNVTLEDIKSVQGAEVRKKNEEKILVNDIEQAWLQVVSSSSSRIDFVLDNSGFELFADLCMALFVLDAGLVKNVVLHCKEIPWFVSDTMPKDFDALLEQLQDPSFFSDIHETEADKQSIDYLVSKLKSYVSSGQISTQHHPFWTSCQEFWALPQQADLYTELKKSDLVIFKGDLNYRKLTGDLDWDTTTPFSVAIQQLASLKLPILALRTCKADVVVGLPAGVNEKLIETYKEMGNEIGEHWKALGKWAVVSFCSGQQ
ncbi:hypothetical protein PUMCH_001524 [Australozyma saopauloensis]|uniref:Sugar phosphate phosphatase n=1 Tax=Australozyma saopauloensis TaxID=291208 RepID=A0AAX4H6P5_9ASCO|nr:hypothetical protein PUMCH_001524 [[Candida] saopauloensis]